MVISFLLQIHEQRDHPKSVKKERTRLSGRWTKWLERKKVWKHLGRKVGCFQAAVAAGRNRGLSAIGLCMPVCLCKIQMSCQGGGNSSEPTELNQLCWAQLCWHSWVTRQLTKFRTAGFLSVAFLFVTLVPEGPLCVFDSPFESIFAVLIDHYVCCCCQLILVVRRESSTWMLKKVFTLLRLLMECLCKT